MVLPPPRNKEVSSAALKALGLEEKVDVAKQPPPQFPDMVQHLWDKKQKSSDKKGNQSAFNPVVFVQVRSQTKSDRKSNQLVPLLISSFSRR